MSKLVVAPSDEPACKKCCSIMLAHPELGDGQAVAAPSAEFDHLKCSAVYRPSMMTRVRMIMVWHLILSPPDDAKPIFTLYMT
jgi:hypothetical protein